ncbi:MAG: hypothetical protein AMXMBFR34_40670 [Myxococcaceae bacterium]
MDRLNALREQLPDAARDIKINLQNVLSQTELSKGQAWGTALACAYATKEKQLSLAILEDAKAAGVEDGTLDDAKAAAILMGMNNVYYRFRHIIGKEEYSQLPARLRMLRTNQTAGSKQDSSCSAWRCRRSATASRACSRTSAWCSKVGWRWARCTTRCASPPPSTRRRWRWPRCPEGRRIC